MKKNEIPPTRAREGLGLPSPRDFPPASGPRESKPRPSLARVGGIYHSFDTLTIGVSDSYTLYFL